MLIENSYFSSMIERPNYWQATVMYVINSNLFMNYGKTSMIYMTKKLELIKLGKSKCFRLNEVWNRKKVYCYIYDENLNWELNKDM